MLWEVEVSPAANEVDREAARVVNEAQALGASTVKTARSARSFILQAASLEYDDVARAAKTLLVDPVTEVCRVWPVAHSRDPQCETTVKVSDRPSNDGLQSSRLDEIEVLQLISVLYKPGVTDNVGMSIQKALVDLGFNVEAVATGRKYWFNEGASSADLDRVTKRVLANDAIERVIVGPLRMESIGAGSEYKFALRTVTIRAMDDAALMHLSKHGQLYLSLAEMQTIKQHWVEQQRDPTDIELETVAQTWSEHCSHKTLKGRIRYRDEHGERVFENMLKETVFGATVEIRKRLGQDDWCVSVFKDNAGVVKFDDKQHVCFKVETHNHPSAIEPYGGANTGIGGVIRDPLGTGLGAKPILNTDVFCFAPPDTPVDSLPPGTLHPKAVMKGVVSGVRDYGNRMGIPTVNGAVFFDERYLGNPLVYCGTAAMIPVGKVEKEVHSGDFIVAVGGRTGRDGIHGATFSSAELTHESETISGDGGRCGPASSRSRPLQRDHRLRSGRLQFGSRRDGRRDRRSRLAGEVPAQIRRPLVHRDLDQRGPRTNGPLRPAEQVGRVFCIVRGRGCRSLRHRPVRKRRPTQTDVPRRNRRRLGDELPARRSSTRRARCGLHATRRNSPRPGFAGRGAGGEGFFFAIGT